MESAANGEVGQIYRCGRNCRPELDIFRQVEKNHGDFEAFAVEPMQALHHDPPATQGPIFVASRSGESQRDVNLGPLAEPVFSKKSDPRLRKMKSRIKNCSFASMRPFQFRIENPRNIAFSCHNLIPS